MPRRTLLLTDAERAALEQWRDRAPRPHLRERAAALLKIADGLAPAQVARTGLLRRRKPDTVYAWLDRYAAEGLAGLQIRPGRGRKPAFPPPRSVIHRPRRRRCWTSCGATRASAGRRGAAGRWT